MHATVRSVIETAPAEDVCILDTEASPEHLSRGTARYADGLLAVVEPYFKSLEAGRRVLALARDLGIEHLALLANKVRARELEVVQEFADKHDLGVIGAIPYDEVFHHAERAAVAPIDYDPSAPAVVAIGKLARKLVRG